MNVKGVPFALLCIQLVLIECAYGDGSEVDTTDPHRDPSLCEVCKFLTSELMGRLVETGKTHEVIETGHGLDTKKKRQPYRTSELRLIEAVSDPHVCEKILEYNIHAERKGSLRFSKGRSETMETLHGLVDKGVKVELGIPYELWDTPSAGVTEMQRKCYKIVEDHEEEIEDWYFNYQDKDLTDFLCRDKVLQADDKECLSEVWTGKEKVYDADKGKGDDETETPPKKSKKGKKKKGKKVKKQLKGETGEAKKDEL